jgi:HAMP domain-containing protein
MDWKSALGKQGLRLMQDPRVARLMQDERVMKAAVQALQMRGRLQQQLEDRVDQVAGALNLATKREIRELKRSLRRMEQELERARTQSGSS